MLLSSLSSSHHFHESLVILFYPRPRLRLALRKWKYLLHPKLGQVDSHSHEHFESSKRLFPTPFSRLPGGPVRNLSVYGLPVRLKAAKIGYLTLLIICYVANSNSGVRVGTSGSESSQNCCNCGCATGRLPYQVCGDTAKLLLGRASPFRPIPDRSLQSNTLIVQWDH